MQGRNGGTGMRDLRPLSATTAAAFCDNTIVNSRYNIYTFFFVSLYEQFRRPLNFYFLLVAVLQFISVIAPVSPFSTLFPLVFAFTTTAIKEGCDDIKRHRQDHAYNSKPRLVLNPVKGIWEEKPNCALRVGDVVLLHRNEEIPCDVIALAATHPNSILIRTDNLDGEIDLKARDLVNLGNHAQERAENPADRGSHSSPAPTALISMDDSIPTLISKLASLRIQCSPPGPMVESFDGTAEFSGSGHLDSENAGAFSAPDDLVQVPLSHVHLLPQSCFLKGCERVLAVAVYTGVDTKCEMNKRSPPAKWAKIDKDINRYSIFIFCMQIASAFTFGLCGYLTNRHISHRCWYLPLPPVEAFASVLIYPLRFFLLTTVMIPISFKFVVDMSKYYMAMTVEWDISMMHHGKEGCKVKNSSILEDLGQIDYVLSDKTGTMTQNVMELRYITVGDDCEVNLSSLDLPPTVVVSPTTANAFRKPGVDVAMSPTSQLRGVEEHAAAVKAVTSPAVLHFTTMLVLCNTVDVVEVADAPGTISYQAASPDEVALCYGSAKMEVRLLVREQHRAVVSVQGNLEEFIIHHVFQYSSEKRSMGVIVEHKSTEKIYFVVKGADDRIITMTERYRLEGEAAVTDTSTGFMRKLRGYARKGLRTLLVAEKEISREALDTFLKSHRVAELDLKNRHQRVDELRTNMETAVRVIGITAIEDKLQENVCETIRDVLDAGIKMWMLTGDKMETAEQIGLSCDLFHANDHVIRIMEDPTGSQDWAEVLLSTPLPPNAGAVLALKRSAASQEKGGVLEAIGQRMVGNVQNYNEDNQGTAASRVREDQGIHNLTGDDRAENFSDTQRSVLIVQGGHVLEQILQSDVLSRHFSELSSRCGSVICARTTPSQKAAITAFVRAKGFMTLSIGDGGNDVAMLQEAHVGIGLTGKEGLQAARAADFSVTQFSDLRPLLFVHGQQAYVRTAYVIKYSFYKSMLISFIQLAYNMVGINYSGGSFWNSFALTMWNGVYTLPQTFCYCFDRCAPRVVLERTPALYKLTKKNVDMLPFEFFGCYVVRGVVQSVMTLWLVSGVLGKYYAHDGDGGNATNDVTFSVAYTALILSQMITVFFESHSITYWNLLWLVGMPVIYVFSTLAYSRVPRLDYFGVFQKSLSLQCWLAAIGIAACLVLPFFVMFVIRNEVEPNCRDVLRAAEVRRQRRLLRNKVYRSVQSFWVRWFYWIPEASSSYQADLLLHAKN